jgi:hypothetical protein
MKKKSMPFLLVLLVVMTVIAPGSRPAGGMQTQVAAEFPAQLLQGDENFNLAIDITGDARGNFGPCG